MLPGSAALRTVVSQNGPCLRDPGFTARAPHHCLLVLLEYFISLLMCVCGVIVVDGVTVCALGCCCQASPFASFGPLLRRVGLSIDRVGLACQGGLGVVETCTWRGCGAVSAGVACRCTQPCNARRSWRGS
jgi:hypothetical protein